MNFDCFSEPNYLNLGIFPNVLNQYYYNAVADRIMNPKNELLSVNNYIKKYLIPPDDLHVKANLEDLDNLFCFNDHEMQTDSLPTAMTKDESKTDSITIAVNNSECGNISCSNEGFFSSENLDISLKKVHDLNFFILNVKLKILIIFNINVVFQIENL